MKINIRSIINSSTANLHNQGLLVYKCLEQCFLQRKKMVLSFAGLENCAIQFLNASIGRLYFYFDQKEVDSLIQYEFDQFHYIEPVIEDVRENALHFKSIG